MTPEERLQANFQRNKQWAKLAESYSTSLKDTEETQFREWLATQKDGPFAEFDPDAKIVDYDARGFWKAAKAGDPRASLAKNPTDNKMHADDFWKTPYHQSFSNESGYAFPTAPYWANNHQLVDPATKQVVFDEKAP